MITTNYNPSPLEVELVNLIETLQPEMNKHLKNAKVVSINKDLTMDNPTVILKTQDADGHFHEFSIKVIQRPDSSVN